MELMCDMSTVSVLMPIYNTPTAHLREAIESILSQTYTDFEFLICNDSPENETLDQIIGEYNDPRIRYIKNEKNKGLEFSTNKLINQSKGTYIAIFDHDDISLPTRIEKQVDYLNRNKGTGVVSAQFTVFGSESWTSDNPIESGEIKKRLREVSCVSHTTMMLRKSILIDSNITYDKKFFPAASYRIITQLALVTDIHNLPDVLLKYRMDGNNTSLKFHKERQIAREKIRKDYMYQYRKNSITKHFDTDTLETFGDVSDDDEQQYFKAQKGDEFFFIKTGKYSFEHEYTVTRKLYNTRPKYFIEPILYVVNGDINFLVTRWNDGISLGDYYSNNRTIATETKHEIADDIATIFKTLEHEKIVHRDLIPRNFLVCDNTVKLLDFYWAVDASNYEEYDYVKGNITLIGDLGEEYALGHYKWDDAYSVVKLLQGLGINDEHPSVGYIASKIGKRVITPSPDMFYTAISHLQKRDYDHSVHINSLQQQITDLQQKNYDLMEVVTDLNQQLYNLNQYNDHIEKSLSWKITKPLRQVRSGIDKIRGSKS